MAVRRYGKTFAAKGNRHTGSPGASGGRLVKKGKLMSFSMNIPAGRGLVSSIGRRGSVKQFGKQVSKADLTQGQRHLSNRVAKPH